MVEFERGPRHRPGRRVMLAACAAVLAGITTAILIAQLSMLPSERPPASQLQPGTSTVTISEAPVTPPRTSTAAPPVPTSPPPVTSPPRSENPVADPPTLAEFVANCERDSTQWKRGQVDYPARLDVELGVTAVYVAAVDIRDTPVPPSQLVSAPDVKGEAIDVQCVLSARIVPDPSITVDDPGWITRRFNPVGALNWSWRVTAAEAGSRQLQLQLQPAVIVDGNPLPGGRPMDTSTFVTRVEVRSSVPQRFGQWWSANWPVLLLVAGGIGAAVLGFVKWGGRLGKAWQSARKAWRDPQS
nr:hypothetical protein [Kibdelosporangium sp. MJ126-NF4]CEL22873.1 hypothetical protein [Kibdelosporangium sp. MJ126-NF4]CTQ90013.1 hypothetical protein [Kibdelosporangium sp. MJ126-NF4]